MAFESIDESEIAAGKPICGPVGFARKVKDSLDYLYGTLGTLSSSEILNGGFEIDSNADGEPDSWDINYYTGGTGELYTTDPPQGAQSWSFIHPGGAGNGGGYADSDYIEVSDLRERWLAFILWATAAGMKVVVQVRYFDKDKEELLAGSPATLYTSTTNPTSATAYAYHYTPPATTCYVKVRLIGGYTDTDVAGTVYFDDVKTGEYPNLMIKEAALAASAVAQAKLKTSSGVTSDLLGPDAGTDALLAGGLYGFYPQVAVSHADAAGSFSIGNAISSTSYITSIYYKNNDADDNRTLYARQLYVTSSGEIHWIFILVEKGSGNHIAHWEAPDHPCFGNRGVIHPFLRYDPAKHDIIVVNPSLDVVRDIELSRYEPDELKPEKNFVQQFIERYEVQESRQADWPDIPVTVGLPRVHNGEIVDDWRFMPRGMVITPVRRVLPRPDYITPLAIRKKSGIIK